jgi:hypothetical protein
VSKCNVGDGEFIYIHNLADSCTFVSLVWFIGIQRHVHHSFSFNVTTRHIRERKSRTNKNGEWKCPVGVCKSSEGYREYQNVSSL